MSAAMFVAKLTDCASEADETVVWLEFAAKCRYLSSADGQALSAQDDRVIAQLVSMLQHPEQWTITRR
jgi:four helix bundle protein